MNTITENALSQLYILRLDHRLDRSLKDKTVGLGWWRAKQLPQIADWDDFKQCIRTAYPDDYKSEYSLGNAGGSLWRFLKSIKKGDLVIVPVHGAFHIGRVLSDVIYDNADANDEIDYAYKRRVEWMNQSDSPIPRSFASGELQRWMKARQTCVEVEATLIPDLTAALKRRTPIDFRQAVIDAAYEHVAKALQDAITDQGFEHVIMKLAASGGAKCHIPPKNSGLPGDVDVIAEFSLANAGLAATIAVGYQVKQHKGISDEFGIQQLIDRMEATPAILRGCFITTADDVTNAARKLADEHQIVVMTKRDLVEWILSVGMAALSAAT